MTLTMPACSVESFQGIFKSSSWRLSEVIIGSKIRWTVKQIACAIWVTTE